MKEQITILLVEDDEVDIMAVKRAFKHNHITNPLYVANDGEDALAFLRCEGNHHEITKKERPRLILLDLHMPRMDGHEFLRQVKAIPDFRDIPVIVLTSSNMPEDVKKSYELGIAGYLVKPVTFSHFVDLVRTLDLYWTLSEIP